MIPPRAIVIPFGVPEGSKGLGLGLASLVHSYARIGDAEIALAQLRSHGSDGNTTGIVEAYVTGTQWRAMPGADETPGHVATILTGVFEPPHKGGGAFSVLAFDAKTGEPRAKLEAVLDADGAGRSILSTLETLCVRIGGDVGELRGLGSLGWDALESLLLAETWRVRALSGEDPSGGIAALAHLGRAVSEAADPNFPAERLATVALEVAQRDPSPRTVGAALRTLDAASVEASSSAALEAGAAALCLRLGRPADAVVRAERAIEREPTRGVGHALLAEAKRLLGDIAGAQRAIATGVTVDGNEPHVRHENATLLCATNDLLGAQVEWQRLLASHPAHLGAFSGLAHIAAERGDGTLAQSVVDHALALGAGAPPEMLRGALQIALQAETPSVARGARLEALSRALTARDPKDGAAALLQARALAEMGDKEAAQARLQLLERSAKGTALASEAARARLHVGDSLAASAIDATLRAATETDAADGAMLESIATRARRLADEHASWVAHLAAAVAERKLGRTQRALADAEHALDLAPSAPLVHVELSLLELALGNRAKSLEHAQRALTLDPTSELARSAVARAQAAETEPATRPSWIDRLLRR